MTLEIRRHCFIQVLKIDFMGCCLNLRKHPGYTQLKRDTFQFGVAQLSSINYFCYVKGTNFKFFLRQQKDSGGAKQNVSNSVITAIMGAREGLPLWDLARDLHHWDHLQILWHTPAIELLLLLHGLHDLHPASREQKVFGDRLALGSLQKCGSTWEESNGWSESQSHTRACEVGERLQTSDAPTHAYSSRMSNGTDRGVTTPLNKDLQKIDFSVCI